MTTTPLNTDTIAALATPQGKGGVGIIRVSGPATCAIAKSLCAIELTPRYAHFCDFLSASGELLDQGIALLFKAPASFTGEDVLELQGHGGPIILDRLLKEILQLGARLARPGEFSERAYLNDKLDLAQAEAIADLIDSQSEQAARNALRSLQGVFSQQIDQMVEQLIKLRLYVEAAIDFPEEEIDFLNDGKVLADLQTIQESLTRIFNTARQGSLLREGMSVVIAGKPNAGKSSLLNALAQRETAIVTAIEGTTRDVLREHIQIDGMPLHIIDTAGLRDSADEVEKEGIRRAWQEIEQADHILLVVDSGQGIPEQDDLLWPQTFANHSLKQNISIILNKCDLTSLTPGLQNDTLQNNPMIAISAKQNLGIEALREHLKNQMGYQNTPDGGFSARRRHLEALEKAQQYLANGYSQLKLSGAGELLAEDLRCAQQALAEITGQFTSDDLLGRIFSSFCIGK